MNIIRRFWRWLTRKSGRSVVFTDAFRTRATSVMGRDNLLVYGDFVRVVRLRHVYGKTDTRGYQSMRSIATFLPTQGGRRRVVVAAKAPGVSRPCRGLRRGPSPQAQLQRTDTEDLT